MAARHLVQAGSKPSRVARSMAAAASPPDLRSARARLRNSAPPPMRPAPRATFATARGPARSGDRRRIGGPREPDGGGAIARRRRRPGPPPSPARCRARSRDGFAPRCPGRARPNPEGGWIRRRHFDPCRFVPDSHRFTYPDDIVSPFASHIADHGGSFRHGQERAMSPRLATPSMDSVHRRRFRGPPAGRDGRGCDGR